MTKRLLIRLFCLFLFATVCGWWISRDVWREHLLGREAYLQAKGAYFDKYLATMSAPPAKFVEYTIFIGVFFALYEGLALILRVIFRVTRIEDVQDPPQTSE